MRRIATLVVTAILSVAGGFGIGALTTHVSPSVPKPLQNAQAYVSKQLHVRDSAWTSGVTPNSVQVSKYAITVVITNGDQVTVALDNNAAGSLPNAQQQIGSVALGKILAHLEGEGAAQLWFENLISQAESYGVSITTKLVPPQSFNGVTESMTWDMKANEVTFSFAPTVN